ncbi:MAG: DUF624 domain-containing protein [Lachnospiraceae bacterium]|nr:DUF624 domain-containing protein [Lachnospiraceae bacterium]
MNRFFNPESGIWNAFGVVGELVMLSLLWGICCIPLLTIGASTTALYDSVVHVIRRQDDNLFNRFWGTFRRELKSGIASTLLWLVISGVLVLLFILLRDNTREEAVRNTGLTLYAILVPFFLLCVLCWVFPILSRFTFQTLALNATALRLAFGHILRSVLMALITLAGFLACYFLISPIMFVPACVAFLWSLLIEPVFRRYETQG